VTWPREIYFVLIQTKQGRGKGEGEVPENRSTLLVAGNSTHRQCDSRYGGWRVQRFQQLGKKKKI